jgi:hypothetical protein
MLMITMCMYATFHDKGRHGYEGDRNGDDGLPGMVYTTTILLIHII